MKYPPRYLRAVWLAVPALFVNAAISADAPSKPPLGLPSVPVPSDNAMTPEKITLGKQLYFDGRLSADNKVSCASCHDPAKGFPTASVLPPGSKGRREAARPRRSSIRRMARCNSGTAARRRLRIRLSGRFRIRSR